MCDCFPHIFGVGTFYFFQRDSAEGPTLRLRNSVQELLRLSGRDAQFLGVSLSVHVSDPLASSQITYRDAIQIVQILVSSFD